MLALVFIVVAWAGLTFVRTASVRYLQKIELAYTAYYRSHQSKPDEMTPPVIWDFERGQLVPVPGDWIAVDSSAADENRNLHLLAVEEEAAKSAPYWTVELAFGKKLSKISPFWFYGLFTLITVLTGVLAWRLRAG